MRKILGVSLLLIVLCYVPMAWATLFAYPKGGQSPEQQTIDDAECQKWAQEQTGFDPAMPLKPVQPSIENRIVQQKNTVKQKEYQEAYNVCMHTRNYVVPK